MKKYLKILFLPLLLVIFFLAYSSVKIIKATNTSVFELNEEIEELVSSPNFDEEEVDPAIQELLTERKDTLLIELADGNARRIVDDYPLTSSTLEKLERARYIDFETDVSNVTGSLEMIAYDDFENPENYKEEYFLAESYEIKYKLYAFNKYSLRPATLIEVKEGKLLGDGLFGAVSTLSVSISAHPQVVATNSTSEITWVVENADSCTGIGGSVGWAGPKNINGGTFITTPLTQTVIFSITCENAQGEVSDSITVHVAPNPAYYINNIMTVYNPETLEPEPYKIGIFLVNPEGENLPFEASEGENLIFDGIINDFFKENSYGKRYLDGDIYGWIETEDENQACSGTMPKEEFGIGIEEIDEYIIQNSVPLQSYNHFLFIVNCPDSNSNFGLSSLGQITLNFNGINYTASRARIIFDDNIFSGTPATSIYPPPFSWRIFDHLITHELGHSFGVLHADGLDCNSLPISSAQHCFIEYGNYFDVMGNPVFSLHFNGMYKKNLGWINPNQILDITSSGHYTINPLETKAGIKFARIFNPAGISGALGLKYSVDNRRAIGLDAGLGLHEEISENQNGLLVHGFYDFPSGLPQTFLFDTTPDEETWWIYDVEDAALVGSNTFSDSTLGITIGPITNLTASRISFDVEIDPNATFPDCSQDDPILTTYSPYTYDISENDNRIEIKVENTDELTCGPSEFRAHGIGLNGVENLPSFYELIGPGEEMTFAWER